MNSIVAALAGAAKDATDELSAPVQAPIFAHAAFERLEAEGARQHGSQIADAVRVVTESTAAAKPKTRKSQRQNGDDELI